MIRYALVCEAGHGFESWFRSSADYDKQRKKGLVACPACGSESIEKQIMKPSVARTDNERAAKSPPPVADEKATISVMSAREQELRNKLKELREHMTKNADYVGDKFPEVARKMHYDEIDQRSIYGEAKPDEVKSLLEEGVEVQPLPPLPEDRN